MATMKGFYQGKASILRRGAVTKNEIGEKVTAYDEVGKTDIRIYSNTSSYVRTEVGYVKVNAWNANVPVKTDIKQGDKISYKGKEYLVTAVDDDAAGVFLKITME